MQTREPMSRARRRHHTASGAAGAQQQPPVRSIEELEAFLHALPGHSREVQLAVETLDLVRPLSLVAPEVTVDRLVLCVSDWERPLKHWNGALGQVPNVLAYSTRYPAEGAGPAQVDIQLTEPTALSEVARGAYPLLGVDRGQHGYGYVELGTADPPAAALALLPSRTAAGIPGIPSHHLEGRGLSRADLGLVGTSRTLEDLRATAEDPELMLVSHPLLVDPSGHLAVSEKAEMPLVDLNIHNPIGRLHTFDEPPGSLGLTADHGGLTFTPTDVTSSPTNDDAVELVGWRRPVTVRLSGREVRQLRDVEAIDLSGLRADGRNDELMLYRRLAELAATGVILHSLPKSFAAADDVLGSTLANLLRAPYRTCTGLVRELRTVPQRREAMQRFGGFFELAGHAKELGHRLLPTVSLVLSSMRPTRAANVLKALSAQRYPHVEIAVGLHGVDGPLNPDFEDAVRRSDAAVFRYAKSTPFGSVLSDTARRTTGDLVVKIDDDDVYGPRVIEDLVLAYLYSNADVVGKTTEYLYLEDIDHTAHRTFQTERYHNQVAGGAMLLSRAVLNEIGGWRPTHNSTDRSILIRVGNSGGIGYRTQSLGYVYVRHSDGHTWEQIDSMLLRHSPEQWPRFMHEIIDA